MVPAVLILDDDPELRAALDRACRLAARSEPAAERSEPDEDPTPPKALRYEDVCLEPRTHEAFRAGECLPLTPLEYNLLECFLRHHEQALSREALSEHVWGHAFHAESNYVDVAVMGLRQKLDAVGGPRLLQTVRGYGYILRAPRRRRSGRRSRPGASRSALSVSPPLPDESPRARPRRRPRRLRR